MMYSKFFPKTPRLVVLILFLFAASFLLLSHSKVSALSNSDFNPGRIIDDGTFFNSGTMNADQIQQFFNAKVPVCDTYGTKLTSHPNGSGGYYTRAQWSQIQGHPTPFVCVKDYHEDIPYSAADSYCSTINGAGNQSAAQIIATVSQACSINPEVLIVLLQKEQSLVTDDWPWPYQYQEATGFGCPDSSPSCQQVYSGFYSQIYRAARQYRLYAKNPNNYNYRVGNYYVAYNPTASCGGSTINIQNQATAGLYDYTPYQPNNAALYGSGDSCSSYGNKNFWTYFNNWFGSTIGACATTPGFSAQSAGGWSMPPGEMQSGDSTTVYIRVINTGSETWHNVAPNQVQLSMVGNQPSMMYTNDGTWINSYRVGMQQASVPPCGVATFKFTYKSPLPPFANSGVSIDKFTLIDNDDQTWFPDYGWFFGVQNNAFAATKVSETSISSSPAPGLDQTLTIGLRNDSSFTWQSGGNYAVFLGIPGDTPSPFDFGPGWANDHRIAMQETSVPPGSVAHYTFNLRTPYGGGTYYQVYSPIWEMHKWLSPVSMYRFDVPRPTYGYSISSVTPSSYTTAVNATEPISITITNTGNTVWHSDGSHPLFLGTQEPQDKISGFYTNSWINPSRMPCTANNVQQGQQATCSFSSLSPANPGVYVASARPLLETLQWLPGTEIQYGMQITP